MATRTMGGGAWRLRPVGCAQARCQQCQKFKSRPSSVCGYCGNDPTSHNMTERERFEFDRAHGYD